MQFETLQDRIKGMYISLKYHCITNTKSLALNVTVALTLSLKYQSCVLKGINEM